MPAGGYFINSAVLFRKNIILRASIRNIIIASAFLCYGLCPGGFISAQEAEEDGLPPYTEPTELLPEQSGTPIYRTDIDGADVDLFLKGSWNAYASFASGIRFGPGDEVVFPWGLPNMREGLIFEQVPDLTFSIWLLERYFMEVTMVKDFEKNTFVLGYQGQEGEVLQSVRIGNRDVFISDYDFLPIPEQGNSSLGAAVVVTPGFSRHEMLLRYDNTLKEEKVFVGFNEVVEKFIPPGEYLPGRSFMLPDAAVTGLEVYIEDKYGDFTGDDGKRYRLASVNDIEQDSEQGLLFILNEVKGRILVYYTKGGNPVGSDGLGLQALPGTLGGYIDPSLPGTNFDWVDDFMFLGQDLRARQVTVSGKICLLIWEPGTFSPFEFLNCYDLPITAPDDLWRVRIKTIPKGDELHTYKNFTYPPVFEIRPGYRVFKVFIDKNNIRTAFRNHYPFPDTSHQLYGPLRDHNPAFFDWEIYAQVVTPVSSFYLSQKVVPGSISVRINGVEETRFEMDYSAGNLKFLTNIRPDDRIEVNYSVAQGAENNGDILFAWGNILPFSELFTLNLAAGVRWNILPGAYAEETFSRTGVVLTSVSLQGRTENLSYKVAGAVSFSNPNTTGILRLLGMEGKGLDLSITEDMAYPAARPAIGGLQDRGRLFYKDYRQYDLLGGYSLQPLDWDVPSAQVFAYDDGSKPGPYLVGESSEGDVDQSLVLDFAFDNIDDWVGFQIPVVAKQGVIDLSRIKAILYSYRVADLAGNVDIYIQAGDLGEDLDGDHVLDEELSKLSRGFQFNDSDNGVNLYVGGGPKGQGNNVVDSEDVDGSGFLDGSDASGTDDSAYIFTSAANTLNAAVGWSVENISLSPADQELLKRVRTVRVVVVNRAVGANSGRILIDNIRLEGTSFWTDDAAGSVSIREVEESFLSAGPAEELEKAFPEVRRIFHNEDQRNEVLETSWLNPTGNTLELKTVFKSGTEGVRYRKIVLYAAKMDLVEAVGSSTISLSVTDIKNKGIRITFPHTLLTNEWQRITIDLEKRNLYINNTRVNPTTFSVGNYDSLINFTVRIDNTNRGILLLDELHLQDPEGAVGAALAVDTAINLPGNIVELGGVPLIADLSVRQNFLTVTPGFASLYGDPAAEFNLDSLTELSCGLLISEFDADLGVQGVGDDWSISGGHSIKIPRQPFPVTFFDRFSVRQQAWGQDFTRSNDLLLAIPQIASMNIYQSALSQERILVQEWRADLNLFALAPYSLSLGTDLNTSSRGFHYQDEWYLESWIYSYRYLVPWDEGIVQDRRWDFTCRQSINTVPLGLGLDMESGYNSYEITSEARSQNNYLILSLTLPLKLGPVTITPGYSRTLNTTRAFARAGSFTGDLDELFREYQAQDYIWTMVPLYELFSEDTKDVFKNKNRDILKASYRPEVSLSMVRSFGSSIWDLIIPSQIDMSLGKEFVRQDTLYDDITIYNLKTKINAINLFGRFGSYPFIDFYTIDEFITNLSLTLTYDKANSLDTYLLDLENHFQFENELKNAFIIKNLLSIAEDEILQISSQGTIEYKWYIRPEEGTPLPLISAEIAATGYYEHSERLEVQIRNLQTDLNSHPINLIITHETSIIFPEFGYIRGEISIGMDWENIPEQLRNTNAVIVGFRLALEINLTF